MLIKVSEPYIIYSLSKDRTTQRFKERLVSQIVENLQHFLQTCTNRKLTNVDTLSLSLYSGNDKSGDEKVSDLVSDQFGILKTSPLFYHYPSGEPSQNTKTEWNLDANQLLTAIDFINNNKTSIELYFSYDFELMDEKMNILPEQQFKSRLSIWLSRRTKSCSPTIFFPFTSSDNSFWQYFDFVNHNFPTLLEEKFLKIARVNKNNEVISFKKVKR